MGRSVDLHYVHMFACRSTIWSTVLMLVRERIKIYRVFLTLVEERRDCVLSRKIARHQNAPRRANMCTLSNVNRPGSQPTHSLNFTECSDAGWSRSTDPVSVSNRQWSDASRSTAQSTDPLTVFNREWRLLCRSTGRSIDSRVWLCPEPDPMRFCASLSPLWYKLESVFLY